MKLALLRVSALGALMALTMGAANAGIINFITLTEASAANGGYGEGAWNSLDLSVPSSTVDVKIKGYNGAAAAYSYLDWGTAGLGVCKVLDGTPALNTKNPGNTGSACTPASDDNVTTNESLSFVFDENVFVKFWFNNNHDGGFGAADRVKINGTDYNPVDGIFSNNSSAANYALKPGNEIGLFAVPAGFDLRLAFSNQEFYVSGMEVFTNNGSGPPNGQPPVIRVPEPASLALAGLALAGLAATRRRRA